MTFVLQQGVSSRRGLANRVMFVGLEQRLGDYGFSIVIGYTTNKRLACRRQWWRPRQSVRCAALGKVRAATGRRTHHSATQSGLAFDGGTAKREHPPSAEVRRVTFSDKGQDQIELRTWRASASDAIDSWPEWAGCTGYTDPATPAGAYVARALSKVSR